MSQLGAAPVRSFIPPTESSRGMPVKSAERSLRILEILAASPKRLTMSELAEVTGYPKSSLHALVDTLEHLGWVDVDPLQSRLGLGPNALITGTAYLDRDLALPFANQTLDRLRNRSEHTFHYARRIGAFVLYLATRNGADRQQAIFRVGRCLPAHATSLGQALLAEYTEEEVSSILAEPLDALTAHTIIDKQILQAELLQIRSRGWAIERDQSTLGVTCIAVPVGYRIPATDAISCSMPSTSATDDEVERVTLLLQEEVGVLAARLRENGIR